MKNQNDLIISVSAIVVALILGGVIFGTRPQAKTVAAPKAVPINEATAPAAAPTFTNGLGNANNQFGAQGGGFEGAAQMGAAGGGRQQQVGSR